MRSSVKTSLVKAWIKKHSPGLSPLALEAAKEHLTFDEAKEKAMSQENESQQNYNAAREEHIELTLAYIKGKPVSLMKR